MSILDAVHNSSPAFANRALSACCKAWKRVYGEVMDEGGSEFKAERLAGEAYRAAMPALTTRETCRDFIACVAQGILLGVIPEKDSGKLLYAAQVALAAVSAEEKAQESAGRTAHAKSSRAQAARVKKSVPIRSPELRAQRSTTQ
jgi:hypothetical protein